MEVLQTIGICVGAAALVAMAVMFFFIWISFVPSSALDIIEPPPPPVKKRRPKKAKPETTENKTSGENNGMA